MNTKIGDLWDWCKFFFELRLQVEDGFKLQAASFTLQAAQEDILAL